MSIVIGFHWLDENIQNHEKSFMFTTQKQPGFPQNFHFNSIKAMSIHVTLFSHLKQLFLVWTSGKLKASHNEIEKKIVIHSN